MKILKNILLSNYFLKIILILVIILSIIRINLNNKSKYDSKEEEFILKIENIHYDNINKKYIINFIGKENLISYYYNSFPYSIGDTVKVHGNLYKVDNQTIPNLFNYRKYLENNDIYYLIKINKISLYKINNNLLYKIKKLIIERINNLPKNEYLYAFILGDKTYLNDNIKASFSYNNISYLLSLGGIKVYLIVKIMNYIKEKLRIKEKKYLFIVCLIFSFFFLLYKKSIGVKRCILNYILKILLKYFHIKYRNDNIIILIGIIFLIINPKYLLQSGFLYSFIIGYGINIYYKNIKGKKILKLFKISILAFILSLPITIYYNYEINILGIIISFVFSFIFHFFLYPLSILIVFFPFLGGFYEFIITIIENISIYLSNITYFSIVIPKVSIILVIIYYLVILNKPIKKVIIFSSIMIFIYKIIFTITLNNFILFLDVHQGDATIIKNNKNTFVIDTGGGINDYSKDIINFLHSMGINKIDILFISHGDSDHIGSSVNLVKNIKVNKVIFNCGEFNNLEKELIKLLDKKNINYYSCINKLNINNNNFNFLQTKEYDNENDNSNVIYTELNGYKFLFMGDASVTTEKEILNKYNLPNIDVLKVGHHGSRTSSSKEFINEINPKYGVISVGKNNRYGHPNKETLDNLKNSKIYRTDENGSIMFKIKNNELKIETCSP